MKKIQKSFAFKLLLFFASIFIWSTTFAQNGITISGSVENKTGPLNGVNITVKGTTKGTLTDTNGNFTLSVPGENVTLTFSFVGYTTQNIIVGSNRTFHVKLEAEDKSLEEVVVIGYGTAKKKELTGATSSVKGSEIAQIPVTTAAQAITG